MNPESPNTPAIPEEIRKQIEELQKSNAAYRRAWELAKGFKESAENKAAQNQWARDSLESEREMNHILTKEISTLEATIQDQDKQILELKGIINAARLALKEICTGTDFPLSTAQNGLQIIDIYLNNK